MKAAVYLRVSTDRQTEANQEPDCARLCAGRGWEPVYFRETESGAKARPQWRRVIEAARTGHVGAVVFWALDRTGRSRTEICRDIEALGAYRVVVTSVKDSWLEQQPGPLRELLLQIMAWVAEGERRRLIERTKAGLDRARLLGKRLGRPPSDSAKVAGGIERVHQGMAVAAAARAAGISRMTLRRALAKKGGATP